MRLSNRPEGSPSKSTNGTSTTPLWIVIALLSAILVVLLVALAILLKRPTTISVQAPAPPNPAAAPAAQDPSLALEPVGTPYLVPAGRSPIPQPGEHFDQALPVQERATKPASRTTTPHAAHAESKPSAITPPPTLDTPAGILTPGQADQHVGQTVTIEGKVIDTYFSTRDQVCFLNFRNDRQGFYVIIFKDVLTAWPQAPHLYFRDKTIRVTGKIFQRGERTQIRVNEASQIQVMN